MYLVRLTLEDVPTITRNRLIARLINISGETVSSGKMRFCLLLATRRGAVFYNCVHMGNTFWVITKKKERIKSPPLQRKEKGNKKGMETWMLQEDLLMCPCVCIYVCVTASMFSLYVMCLNAVLWMLQTRDKQSVHSRETLNQWIWIMNNSPKALNSKENTVRVKVTAQCESERLTRTEKTGDRESFLLQSCQNIAVRTVG